MGEPGLAECALLVTAHPDDEAMFWAPTILALVEQGLRVALLCLSTGNADGLGQLRSRELYRACSLLGMRRQDVTIVDDPQLQDGMQQRWPADVVAEHVAAAVQRLQPSRVYTFDAGGVSGHPNHLAVCAGVLRWWAAAPSSSSSASLPQLWQLETVGLLRKYAALLDAPLAWATTALQRQRRGRGQAAWHLCRQPRRAQQALLAHSSQMVWYRRLWLLLSRYMYVNTLVRRL
ncbi:N-acetylglucosaminyl-phosphatidylinositol de-N-acetylase isoform C [Chlorella sorokiniana]|uniref:N-acetylglucosaminylphosphatidylinositol deacetylase n=1 Tax=Chlorella sorokiniana TaxID=3076 RepID=A0A2P6TVW9_CHLSO|nr:N-acetylglucosaminyl-phosphatidylinositol de-N-acetylase isoform A [Chlorella sorokiniana]PRW58202.1 N-acetylglucosaminyl-phosphatidylinositol de-N-acetylase isoform B [Chlorella sorokiniana]PRW58203.1 N-acetylglucosaminyl-phosphatidylinositol de-N-acetylase isoform C [Chlorella sorokiniana]|eukprot:PRW58201.1 N-acetylglucosaminyl-phosphatidylinositol de-N-acetylase isoform A [Chlorella sorokiniana]